MTLDPKSLELKPATPEDKDFLFTVYASSREDDLKSLGWTVDQIGEFLEMQFEAQQRLLANEYKQAEDQIIVAGEKRVGRVLVERRDHEIRGVDIAILPQFRSQGIGSAIIARLQLEARQASKPLRIQVIRFSRAIALFERLGFVRTAETGTHYQMEWQPNS
jgi:GNAT superfamily N-acetyltransferase